MTKIITRRGTAAEWTSADPILLDGELGFETDTGKLKGGNGVDVWTDLPYVGAGGGVSWGDIGGTLSNQTDLQTSLNAKQATLISGTNIKTVNSNSLLGSGDISISSTVAWGAITGTLSSQSDLQSALDGKEPTITAGTSAQYWRGDKTFQTLDKSAVGLGNVDNTSDANKPVSTATQTALDLKANLASPTFTGTVTLPAGQVVNGVTLSTAEGASEFLRGDGTYAIPPSGSANAGTATIDFGAFPGASDASVDVTGQSAIVSGSVVNAWLQPATTSDHSADEHVIETIKVVAGNIQDGVGFTIYAVNTSQLNEPLIPMKGLTGTLAGQLSAPGTFLLLTQGGAGTRIYGQWNVGWTWA